MELDNRTPAALILTSGFLAWMLSHLSVRAGLRAILASICHPLILAPVLGLAASVALLVFAADRVGLWEPALVPATVVWVLGPGISLLYNAATRKEGQAMFRPALARIIRLTWTVEVFVGFYVLGIAAELALLFVIGTLGALSAVAASQKQYRSVKRVVDSAIGLIGLGLLTYVTASLVLNWNNFDKALAVRAFLLPPGLTIGVLPYLFLLSVWAAYHDAFVWINHEADGRRVRWRAKVGLMLAFGVRVSRAPAFRTYWARQITEADSIREARRVGRAFLRDRQRQVDEEAADAERLKRYAGADGEDESGERLDQREFAETKRVLQRLATMQTGWYRNRGERYRPELLELLRADGLPEDHGIRLSVAADGKSWWAWRRTITGWCFAISAAAGPPDQWLYDGPDPPRGFPGQDPAWGERWGLDAKNW